MAVKDDRLKGNMLVCSILACLALTSRVLPVAAFGSALFQEVPTLQQTFRSSAGEVDIELPDFDELFERIQQVSPLARSVITGNNHQKKGFEGIDDHWPTNMQWKTIESNKRRIVHQIQKIDNFQGKPAPIIRFRSSLKGPCVGECFGNFIMDLEERKKWDPQIAQVYEIHPIFDLDAANIAMGFGKYGECSRLGVGYCQTKANFGITPREQLTLCGVQNFAADGSCIIWGVEMEEWHDHLLPPGQRQTRAKSHIFSTTLTPTSDNTFDVEYVLQLEIGGKIPTFLTTPIVTDTVKSLFQRASDFFAAGEGGELDQFLKKKEAEASVNNRHSLLVTP